MKHIVATARTFYTPNKAEHEFKSIKEAAEWLIATNQATTGGRLAAYQTVRTNVNKSIVQPDIYPHMYGYSWREIERSE